MIRLFKYPAFVFFFFFNDTATTEIYTLSLHDALPICGLPFSGASAAATATACEQDRQHQDSNNPPFSAANRHPSEAVSRRVTQGSRPPPCPLIPSLYGWGRLHSLLEARLEDGLDLVRLDTARLDLLRPVAGDEVALGELAKRRHVGLAAGRLHVRAACVEAAGGRRVRRARQVAGEEDRLALGFDLGIGDR